MLEIKPFSAWSQDHSDAPPTEQYRGYSTYLRSAHFKNGTLNEQTENEINEGMYQKAVADGLIAEDAPEEEKQATFNKLSGAEPSDPTFTNAQFLPDYLRYNFDRNSPEFAQASLVEKYLAAQRINSPLAAEHRADIEPLLSNQAMINAARKAAVDRGDIPVVSYTTDKGEKALHFGANATRDNISGQVDSLLSLGAIDASDLKRANQYLEPLNGGVANGAQAVRASAALNFLADTINSDDSLKKNFGSVIEKTRRDKQVEAMSTGERALDITKQAIALPFNIAAEVITGTGRAVGGLFGAEYAPEEEPASLDLSKAKAALQSKGYSAEEVERYTDDFIKRSMGPVYRADNPASGFDTDSLGNVLIAPELVGNVPKFEQALAAADLNEEQKVQAAQERRAELEKLTPAHLDLVLGESPEALDAYNAAKAKGISSTDFLESWLSDEKNYDGFSERLQQFGLSTLSAVAQPVLGVFALSGSESAAKGLAALNREAAQRQKFSRLYGDEYGLGFQIINTVPQVGADILLSVGTGAAYTGLKATTSAGIKGVLRNASKQAVAELGEDAALAVTRASTLTGSTSEAFGKVSQGLTKSLNIAENYAPVAASSFIRSASSTYGQLYDELPEDMSHEEKHKAVLGTSILSGLSTMVTVVGMGLLGRGGVEDIATGGLRIGGKTVPMNKLTYRQMKMFADETSPVIGKLTDKAFQQSLRASMGSAYRNFFRHTLKGGFDEAVEEMLDQSIQIKIMDAYKNQDTPFADFASQLWTAGVIGGALGGGTAAGGQLLSRPTVNDTIRAASARYDLLNRATERLKAAGSPITASILEERMIEAEQRLAEERSAQAIKDAQASETMTPDSSTLNPDFGKATEDPELPRPAYTELLTDLEGETVKHGRYSGRVVIEEDQAYLELDKPEMGPDQKQFSRIRLGSAIEPASNTVSRTSSFRVLDTPVKGFAAGTPFYQRGKSRFVLPDPATADIERDFKVITNENGRAVSIVVKAARSFDKSEVSVPRTVDSPSDMRVLGRIYGIDVDPVSTQAKSFVGVSGDFKPVRSIAKQSQLELSYDPASFQQGKKAEAWSIDINKDSQPILTVAKGKKEQKRLLPPTEEMRPMAALVVFNDDNTVQSLFFRNTLQVGSNEPTPYFERDPERIQQLAKLYNLRLDGNDSPSEAFVDDKHGRFSFLDNMAGAQLPALPVVDVEAEAATEEAAPPVVVGDGQLELGLEGAVPDYSDRISKAGMAKAVAAAAAQVASLRAKLPEGAATAISDLTTAEKEVERARASLTTAQTQLEKATDKTREARTATVTTRTEQLAAAEQKLAAARKAPSLKASEKVAAAEKRLQDLQAAFDRITEGEMEHLLGERLSPELKLEYSAAVAAAYPVDETAEEVMNTILSLDPAPRARTARRIAQQTYEGFTPEQIEGALARADAMIDFGIARLEDEAAPADVAREIISAGETIKSRIATFQGVVEDEIDLRRFRQIDEEGQRLLDQYEADVAKANREPVAYTVEELEADYARFEQMSDEEFARISERIASNQRPRLAARLGVLRARADKETALPSVEEIFDTPEVAEEVQSGEPEVAITVDSFPEVLSRFNALIQNYKEAVLTAQGEAITKGKSQKAATRAAGQLRSSIQPQLREEAFRIIDLIRQNNELDDVVQAEYEAEVLRTVGRNFDDAVSRLLNSKRKVERTMNDAPKFKGIVKKTGVGFRTKQEKELFDLLASNGQIVTDLRGVGELLPEYRAVVNNVVYNAFTMASPDLQKDGARYYKPSEYTDTKKRMLAERVQELYPETGYLRKSAGKRGGYEYVVGKQVYPAVYVTGVKGYMRVLKKDGDPNKASDFTYVDGAYAPYIPTSRRTDTADGGVGVFTNNPVAVRAQLAKNMTIEPFPKSFKKRNPSIALSGDQPVGFYLPTDLGLTDPLYGDSKLVDPKFADRSKPKGPNTTSLDARQTSRGGSLDALFFTEGGGMILPSPRTSLGGHFDAEEYRLLSLVSRILDRNASRPRDKINYRLPVTPEGISRARVAMIREFRTQFQEARLARLTAQYVAKQLVQKVRKGQELSPDMVAYMEAKEISAETAPPSQLKEIVELYAKDADGSLGSAASVVNITAFMKDMFPTMTIDELAGHVSTVYPDTSSPDATGVLTKYAQKLLQSVTPTGDYYTLPTARSVRERSFNRHTNTAAASEIRARQKLEKEIPVSDLEILGVLDRNDVTVYSSRYRGEDDPQGEQQDRFSGNSIARAFEQLEGGDVTMSNAILGFKGLGVEPIRLPAEENNPLLYTKSDLLTDEFRAAVRGNPAVASLVKQLAMKYDPELAVLNGVELLSKLSGKVAEQEAEMNPAAFQFIRALQNKNTKVGAIGQKLAAHLVLSGWLPPSSMYRLARSVTRRPDGTLVVSSNVPVKTKLGMLSPSEHAIHVGATSNMTPEQILEKGAAARQAAANEFKDTFGKSEAEATEEHNAFIEAARLAQSTLLTLNQERLLRINEASLAQFRVGQLQERLTLLIGGEADMNAEEAIEAGVANQQALLKSYRKESRELYGKARRVDKEVEQALSSAADLPALVKQRQEFSDLLAGKRKTRAKFPSTEIASRIVGLDRLILKVEAMSHPSKVAALRAESRQYRDEARALADRAKQLKDLPIRSLLLNTAQELREFVNKANMSTEAANMLSQQAKDVLALAQSKPYQMLADIASTDPAYLREKGKLTSLTDAERNIIAQAFIDKQSGKQSQDRLASATKSLAKFLKDSGFNVRSRQTTQQTPEGLFTQAEAPVIPPPPAGVTEFSVYDLGVPAEGVVFQEVSPQRFGELSEALRADMWQRRAVRHSVDEDGYISAAVTYEYPDGSTAQETLRGSRVSDVLLRREVRAEGENTVIEYTYYDGSTQTETMEGRPSTAESISATSPVSYIGRLQQAAEQIRIEEAAAAEEIQRSNVLTYADWEAAYDQYAAARTAAAQQQNPEAFAPQLGRVRSAEAEQERAAVMSERAEVAAQEAAYNASTNPESFRPRLSRVRSEPSFLGEFRSAGIFTTQTEAEIVAANKAEADRLGLVNGDPASVINALRVITKSGKPVQKAVASMLLANPSIVANATFVMAEFNRVDAGFYDPDTNIVAINLDGTNGRGLADVLLHEYIHAGTLDLIRNPQTKAQREAVQRLTALRNLTSQIAAQRGIDSAVFRAGLANNAEFVTYSLTAPEFQAILAQLSPPSQRSIWQRILDTIADFFGVGRETVNNALDEILNFTSMAFTTPNTFGESVSLESARDQDALAPQVARAERAVVAARAAVADVAEGGASTQSAVLFSIGNVQKLNTPSGISLQSFASAFASRIKPETKTYQQALEISRDIIYDHIINPEKYIVKATEEGISGMYRRFLIMPDGKEYDPNNIEHASASDQTISIHRMIEDGSFDDNVRNTVDSVNGQRAGDIHTLAFYLYDNTPSRNSEGDALYDSAEAAILLIAASKYAVRSEPDAAAKNGLRYRAIEMTSGDENRPFIADGKTASDVMGYLRAGKGIKDAVTLAYTKQQTQAAEAPNKFGTGWYVFKKSSKHEDAVELNAAVASTSWCTGGSVNTAKTHLTGGDFHVYFENGKPEVAIRTNDGHLAEPPRGNTPNQMRTQKHDDILADYFSRSDTGLIGVEDFNADRKFLDRVTKEKGFSQFTDLELISTPQYRRSSNGFGLDSDKWPESIYANLEQEIRKRKDSIYYVEADSIDEFDIDNFQELLEQVPSNAEYIFGKTDAYVAVDIEKFPKLIATNLRVMVSISNGDVAPNLSHAKSVLFNLPSKLDRAGEIEVNLPNLESTNMVFIGEAASDARVVATFPKLKTVETISVSNAEVEFPVLTTSTNVYVEELGSIYAPILKSVTQLDVKGSVSMPSLARIDSAFKLREDSVFDLPNLTSVLAISGVEGSHELPALTTIDRYLAYVEGPLSLPRLTTIGESIMEVSVDLVLPELTTIGDSVEVEQGITLELPKVTKVGRIYMDRPNARLIAPELVTVIRRVEVETGQLIAPKLSRDPKGTTTPKGKVRVGARARDGVNYVRQATNLAGTRGGELAVDPIEVARAAMPQGVEMVEDPQLAGVAGFSRANPNQILVNPNYLAQSVKGLPAHKAEAVIRSTIDEEVAHMAADAVFSEADYADIAEVMGETGLSLAAHEYYSLKYPSFTERSAAIRADRESGILSDVTLAAEWTRIQVSRMATGTTRERDLDMILDNKSLVDKLVTALLRFVETLRERFNLSPTASTAAKISQASRMMRRLRNEGVLPTPEPSPEGEMGDTTYLLAALGNQTVEGQEDRTSFAVPVAAVNPDQKSFIERFWDTVGERGRVYNMPTALRNAYNDRGGMLSSAQYDIQLFNKKFARLRDAAMADGIPMEDLMVVLGTTEPIVSTPEQIRIRKELRAYRNSLSPQDPDFEQKVREKENDLTQGAALTFRAAFRKKQEAMEQTLRSRGYDEVVDLMVDFRTRMNKLKTVVKWDSTNDVYLTRLYRYYDTPGWHAAVRNGTVFTDDTGTEVDFSARRRVAAHSLYEAEVLADLQSEGIAATPDLIGQRVLAKLDEHLDKLDKMHAEEYSPSMTSSIRQDTNLLKNKREVDEKLRELLGEVKDPLEVAVRTMHSLSRMAANKKFYDSFESIAISQGLASYTPTDNMDLLFPSRQSDRYGKLAGLYVRKDIANALREELDLQLGGGKSNATGAIASVTNGLTHFSGLAITAKTALGVGYWTRNIIGGGLLTVSQGLTPISRDSLASFKSAWKGNFIGAESDENQREVIRRLTELQILRDDTQGRMITDMMRGFMTNPDQALDEALQMILEAQATGNMEKVKGLWDKVYKTPIEKVTSVSATLNNFVDSFFKTNAYFQELRMLKDKFGDTHSEGELEQRAAYKVKLTFPTHSQTLDITRAFNRSPLALLFLPFLRWKTEIVRTMINTPLLAASEMKNGEFTRGLRRLVGFSTVVGGGGTIVGKVVAMIFSLLGDDEDEKDGKRNLTAEEQDQIRMGLPKWQRLHALHMTKMGGSIQVIDLNNIMPHSVVTGVFSLAVDAARSGRGISAKEMAAFIKSEVLGSNIAATAVNEALNNRDDFGRPIYDESDSPLETMGKWLRHVGSGTITPAIVSKTVGPYGMFRKGEKNRLEMALGELTGTRPQLHELNTVLDRGMRTVKQGLDEAVGVRAPLLSGKALDLDEIPEIFDEQQRKLNANQKKLGDLLRVMKSLGVEDSMIFEKTKDTGLSKQKVALAMEGKQLRYTPNAQVLQKMDTNIKALGEEESAEPRFQRLMDYAEAQPEIYDVDSY